MGLLTQGLEPHTLLLHGRLPERREPLLAAAAELCLIEEVVFCRRGRLLDAGPLAWLREGSRLFGLRAGRNSVWNHGLKKCRIA